MNVTHKPAPETVKEQDHREPASRATACGLSSDARSAAAEMLALHFRVLSEPMRIRILQLLQDGERTVSEIADALDATQPNISRHLHILSTAGVVALRHDKGAVHCGIRDARALAVCDLVCRSLGSQLDRQGKLAKKLKS